MVSCIFFSTRETVSSLSVGNLATSMPILIYFYIELLHVVTRDLQKSAIVAICNMHKRLFRFYLLYSDR